MPGNRKNESFFTSDSDETATLRRRISDHESHNFQSTHAPITAPALETSLVQQLQLRNVLWAAEALHGDRTQAERIATLAHFDSGGCRVLVATDVGITWTRCGMTAAS